MSPGSLVEHNIRCRGAPRSGKVHVHVHKVGALAITCMLHLHTMDGSRMWGLDSYAVLVFSNDTEAAQVVELLNGLVSNLSRTRLVARIARNQS